MSDTPNDALRQVHHVKQLIERGALDEGAQHLDALLRVLPTHPYPHMLGMRLAEASGDLAAALQAAERAVQCAPQWPVAVLELAALLARQGRRAEAVQHARRAVALAPDDLPVLARAIDATHAAHDFQTPRPWLLRARALAPQDRAICLAAARNAAHRRAHAEACAAYAELLARDPDDADALVERIGVADALGDKATALADVERLLQRDPHNATYRFWQARARGEVPATQPRQMVERLFDSVAPTYDQVLLQGLQYAVPQRIAGLVRAAFPELGIDLLDLGCGTGLLGVQLGRLGGTLIGVDISQKMLEQARQHGLYDQLLHADVLDALAQAPASSYHAVAACEVFEYIGNLQRVVRAAFGVLRAGGLFVFSCEAAEGSGTDGAGYVLQDSIRYAHRPEAVETLCRTAGFDPVVVHADRLRLEHGRPVAGFYVVAHRPP